VALAAQFGLKMRRVQPPAQRLFELRGDCDQRALFAAAADQLHPDGELGVRATMSGSRAAAAVVRPVTLKHGLCMALQRAAKERASVHPLVDRARRSRAG
jgi:hypothetical protein